MARDEVVILLVVKIVSSGAPGPVAVTNAKPNSAVPVEMLVLWALQTHLHVMTRSCWFHDAFVIVCSIRRRCIGLFSVGKTVFLVCIGIVELITHCLSLRLLEFPTPVPPRESSAFSMFSVSPFCVQM